MSARDDYPFHAAMELLNQHSIHTSALDEIDRLRAENATVALALYEQAGWGPWSL